MRLKSVALIIALAFPSPLVAENYKLISSNASQMILADADGIASRPKSIVRLWAITLRALNHFLLKEIAIVKMLKGTAAHGIVGFATICRRECSDLV